MIRRGLTILSLSLLAAGCTCGAFDPNSTRFACASDDDCGPGFVCAKRGTAFECVTEASATGGGTATGGGSATGGGTATGGGGETGGGGGATGGGTGGGGDVTGGGGGATTGGGGGATTGGGGGATTGGGGGATTGGGGGAMTGGGGGATTGGGGGAMTGGGGGATTGGGGGAMTGGGGGSSQASLVFTSAPQTVYINTCSAAVVLGLRDGAGQPATAPSTFSVNLTATTGVTFYSNSTCGTPTTMATFTTGSGSATVYFRAFATGSAMLTASFTALLPATQPATIVSPPQNLRFTSIAPSQSIPAGTCFPARVEARGNNGLPVNVIADTNVALTANNPDGVRFYRDAACTQQVTSTTIPSGQSSVSFGIKGISGGGQNYSAQTSFGQDSQTVDVIDAVRRGTCTLGTLSNQTTCTINPELQSISKAFLTFQIRTSAGSPEVYGIRCRLIDTRTIQCSRRAGTSSGTSATISWQVVELAQGLAVQHFTTSCPSMTTPFPLSPRIDPTKSFVLSSFTGVGTNFDGDELNVMRLDSDGGVVTFEPSPGNQACDGLDAQVVSLDGISVVRGGATLNPGERSTSVTVPSTASANSLVLSTALLSATPTLPNSASMCNFFVRSAFTPPQDLTFTRAATNTSPSCVQAAFSDLPWERIDFRARATVQTFQVGFLSGQSSTEVSFARIDQTRAFVLASGQLIGGQGTGETGNNNGGDDTGGVAMATFEFAAGDKLRVTRGDQMGVAAFTVYLVELEP